MSRPREVRLSIFNRMISAVKYATEALLNRVISRLRERGV